MGLKIPSAGVPFSASDIQLAALAPKIPKLNAFKNVQYYTAEQLWNMGTSAVNGSGTAAFNATLQQIELKTTVNVGDWADLIIQLPVSGFPNSSIGFTDDFGFASAGHFSISLDILVSRFSGPAPSGSGRPWSNFYIERLPVAGAIEMSNEGFGIQISNEFTAPMELKAHNGTVLTTENIPSGQVALYSIRGNLILEHFNPEPSGVREFSAYQNNSGSTPEGAARQIGSTMLDKHYSNNSRACQLHFTIGNNAKASAWIMAIGGIWVSATQN